MKIACLWVPELSLIAALRAEPQLCTEPLAVVQAELGGRAHVLGATGAAEGVEAGQTLAEARAICPRLLSREASPERERAAAQAAREAASAVSPRVEEAGPGLVYLDVSGLESLIGDDRAVARALVAATERVGVRAAVGLGSSKSVARLAARAGPEAALLSRLARGEDSSALAPRPEPSLFEEGEELEWDASSIEPLLFVWKGLLDRLAQRLSARGLMARELRLQLRLADGSWDERALDLAAPTREVAALLQLLRLSVESGPPPAGVRAVRLTAVTTREVLEQMPLFGSRGASPTQLAAAVARLSALVGPGRVGRPEEPDRWAPFAAACRKFAPPPPPRVPLPPEIEI